MPGAAAHCESPEVSEGAGGSGAASRDGSDESSYAARLERSTRELLELSMRVLGEIEEVVSPSHLRALQVLASLGGAKVSALGEALGVPPSTASRISDRLTAAGLVTREVARDNRRATWLAAHPGRRRGARRTRAGQALARVTDRMSASQREALLAGAKAFTEARASGDDEHDAQP